MSFIRPGFADHVLVPGPVPDEPHIRFIDALDPQDFPLRVVCNRRRQSATQGSQGHFHFAINFRVIIVQPQGVQIVAVT
jgi:hypothetical protein